METALIGFLVKYGVPAVFAALAAYKTFRQRQSDTKSNVTQAALDLLTTAIEPTEDPNVKEDVKRLTKGTGVDVERAIKSSIDRLNPHKIRDMIRARKVPQK